MEFEHSIVTSGDGLWSEEAKNVQILSINVPYANAEQTFGELRVYFNTSDWDIRTAGLIYTDHHFLKTLQVLLTLAGFNGVDVDYSEQGMQGVDYVSLDIGEEFLRSWRLANAQ